MVERLLLRSRRFGLDIFGQAGLFQFVLFDGVDLIGQLIFGTVRIILQVVAKVVSRGESLSADGGLAAHEGAGHQCTAREGDKRTSSVTKSFHG